MRRRRKRVSKSAIFVALLIVAFVAIWLPARWTRPFGNVMQLFAPAQQAINSASQNAGDAIDKLAMGSVPGAEHVELQRRTNQLENHVLALSQQVRDLQQQNEDLAKLRHGALGSRGQLIPARVVRYDAADWRDGLAIDRGDTNGVRQNAAVVAMMTEAAASEGGLSALLSSVFIGQVTGLSPYTSEVQLLSDPESGIQVRVGRVEGGRFVEVPADFILRGVGNGRMVIIESPQRHRESGAIRVGDAVVSLEGQNGLPHSLLIGRITDIVADDDQPLSLDRLHVRPAIDTTTLTRVYVADFGRPAGAG